MVGNVRYLFDIKDTHPSGKASKPLGWQITDANRYPTLQALQEKHNAESLPEIFGLQAALFVAQHGKQLDADLQNAVIGSTLEWAKPQEQTAIFANLITQSAVYMAAVRCGLGDSAVPQDAFADIDRFDTESAVLALGNAVNRGTADVCRNRRCRQEHRQCCKDPAELPPIRTYQKTLPHDTVYYLGIAADEPIRLARLKANQTSLLAKYNLTENDAQAMCQAEGLLSPLYAFTGRGGCWFCPNASMRELRHRYQQQTHLLWEHRLQTLAEVQAHKSNLENQIEQLARQRKVLYRQKLEPERAAREEKIKSLTQQMKALRHEVYICSDIETDAAEVQEKLRQAELAAQEERNEVKQDEQRRRSSRSDGAGSLTGYRGGY